MSKNWQRIKFLCSNCFKESWMEVDIDTYIIKDSDLICDDCLENEVEE